MLRTSGLARSFSRNQTAVFLLVAQLTIAVGAFIVNILAARALGPSARGELALFLQIAYAVNLLCLLGRQRALLRYPSKNHSLSSSYSDGRRLSGLPVIISTLAAVVIGLAFQHWDLAALVLIVAFLVKLSSGVLVNMHRAAAIASTTAKPFLFATVASQTLLVVGSLVFVAIPLDEPEPWLLLYGLSAALPYLVTELIISRKYRATRRERSELAGISRLGFRLLPAGLAQAILARSDRFLLPVFSPYSQLGIYAVVLTMSELIAWPANQYADSRIPSWRAAYEENRLRWLAALVKVLALCSGIAVLVSTAIYLLLVPVFGQDYADGRALVLPLTLVAVLQCIVSFGVSMGVAVGSPGAVTMIPASGMVFAIPGLLILIPMHEAAGAAWAMVIGHTIAALVTLVFLRHVTKKVRARAVLQGSGEDASIN